jgi:hypothetical protein
MRLPGDSRVQPPRLRQIEPAWRRAWRKYRLAGVAAAARYTAQAFERRSETIARIRATSAPLATERRLTCAQGK